MKDNKLGSALRSIEDDRFLQRLDNDDLGDIPDISAPDELSRRLSRIPRTERWAKPSLNIAIFSAALAASILVAVFFVADIQQVPSQGELARAQQELRVALHYLQKTQSIAQVHVQRSMTRKIKKSTLEPLIEAIPFTTPENARTSS